MSETQLRSYRLTLLNAVTIMTEQELKQYLCTNYPKEDETCDWKEMKNLKNSFAAQEGDDVISYVSAIANMDGGHLVIGVQDKTLEIIGTDLSKLMFNGSQATPESATFKLTEHCTNLSSEGLFIEEFVTDDTHKTVWVIHIPKHLPRRPVYAHKKAWQRVKDSLVQMRAERLETILSELLAVEDDWSAMIIPEATIDDLDPKAIEVARENYADKHPKLKEEMKAWSDIQFLNNAKVTRNGQITNTAIILLGKPQSEVLISPAVSKIRWVLKNNQNEERDYEICSCPMILSVERIYKKVRNLTYRMINPALDTQYPDEMETYEPYVIHEALNNAIAHQIYAKGGMINIVEFDDRLVFTNLGSFIPGNVRKVLESDAPQENYHNKFLAAAMVELEMVDTIGSGIRRMFGYQRKRLFPMPDYDFSDGRVKLTIYGKVLDQNYANMLAHNTSLTLSDVEMLNRVQLSKPLTDDEVAYLRKHKLVEGRKNALMVSKEIAQLTGQKVEYSLNKGFDDQYYRDLILKAVTEHGSLSRKEIDTMLMNKLPDVLNQKQKISKIGHLLTSLREAKKIEVGEKKKWTLKTM